MDGFLRRLGFGLTLLAAAAAGAAAVMLLVQDSTEMPIWLPRAAAGLVFLVLITSLFSMTLMARRVDRLRADLDTLSVSMDQAVRDLAKRAERDAPPFADQQSRDSRESEGATPKVPVREDVARIAEPVERDARPEREAQADPGNVVPYPHAKLNRKTVPPRSPVPGTAAVVAGLVRQALAAQTVDLSLKPIISMARGAAAGFDVFAFFESDGEGLVLPANATDIPDADRSAFEALVIDMTIATARRRLGSASQPTPLHASVTEAFLLDSAGVAKLLDVVDVADPPANALVVLSVPAVVARKDGPTFPTLQKLAEGGVRIALEDLPYGAADAIPPALRIAFIKVPARRLLADSADGRELAAMASAAGAQLIAVDVDSDEDAIALIDKGISLMSGSRFSGPRRLRPDDEAVIERFSRTSVNNW